MESKCVESEEWTPLYKASMHMMEDLHEILANVKSKYGCDSEGKGGEEDEFPLELTAAHKEYMKASERLLDDFLEKEGVSRDEFFEECRQSMEGTFCALFEEDVNLWFVESLLAITDFEHFAKSLRQLPSRKIRRK